MARFLLVLECTCVVTAILMALGNMLVSTFLSKGVAVTLDLLVLASVGQGIIGALLGLIRFLTLGSYLLLAQRRSPSLWMGARIAANTALFSYSAVLIWYQMQRVYYDSDGLIYPVVVAGVVTLTWCLLDCIVAVGHCCYVFNRDYQTMDLPW